MDIANLFDAGEQTPEETTVVLYENATTRIERIVSWGQTSPEDFWYDQDEDEWLVLLKGRAILRFDDGQLQPLYKGKPFLIPAHVRHQVAATTSPTIWLCVFGRLPQ
ncbi:MAG: cupin domain-containing protein [Peptococcaceae bacterium]|nr:cupin domain-containing protein [Peptococcaceae bacterium]